MSRILAFGIGVGLMHLTSGCIAAAIPLAAGAAIVKSDSIRGGNAARQAGGSAITTASDLVVPSSPAANSASKFGVTAGNPAISAFRSYALEKAETRAGTGKRVSAILPSAKDLRVARSDCGKMPLAVFIDLDPGRKSFDPLDPGRPDPALGAALDSLRRSGIKVVWFSRLSASFSEATHAALVDSGLDFGGSGDSLALLSDLAERKQSLRDNFAKHYCPIAILGDERSDFDELYLYLKNPDAALALDAMIGNGWFLASPFLPRSVPASGAIR